MDEPTNPYEAPQTPIDVSPGATVVDSESRMWGMLCHLSALSAYVTVFGGILGPLIVWLVKKDTMPFVDDQGKESLNFQISMLIYHLLGLALLFCFLIGIPVLIVLSAMNIVLIIVASMKANSGEVYRYPLTLRLIR
ncbi:MAG TPA: DUF4870 domain-containing protein [Pirellulales bacterium]|nr:DUF4870 domain-containing protein [Pirellulales bacterium]